MPVPFVLASASPARRSLLRSSGIEPRVVVSAVDEAAVIAEIEAVAGPLDPADHALALARAKADAVCRELGSESGSLVLGCDSVLELDGAALGKPLDAADAVLRWQQMRGRTGVLHTGHWLVDDRGASDGGTAGALGAVASTTVQFGQVDDDEIAAYVATGEPLHVAGAFTLESLGAAYIDRIDGDPSNVTGLSLPLLRHLLLELGIPWRALRA